MNTTERMREYRAERKAAGLCIRCDKKPVVGRVLCSQHAEEQLSASIKLNQAYKKTVFDYFGNVCNCCGETNLIFLTVDHIENDGAAKRREMTDNGYRFSYQWIVKNKFPPGLQLLCYNCNCGKVINNGICPHKKSASPSRNASDTCNRKRRQQVFDHYGNKCNCCGESNPMFFTIDHINEDGSIHRKAAFTNTNNKGVYMCQWLIKNNYPPGFQLLCWNCNSGKYRNGGICPHKEIK